MPLDALPSEVLHLILAHLDIPSLLSFSRTSSTNHTQHLRTLQTLHLAIFPKKVQSLIAFLQHSDIDSTNYSHASRCQVAITLPRRPSRHIKPKEYRTSIITSQNTQLTTLLYRYSRSLETLSFHAWDILPETASALAENCSRLRHLSLCFDHAASRDPCIPSGYFEEPTKASSLWNALAGLGLENEGKLVMRNLTSLKLERAGCTSAQLRVIVARNPGLTRLRLRKVRGVDKEFVEWLGLQANRCRENLAVLCIDECKSLELRATQDYSWLGGLENLTSLRISGCVHVDEKKLRVNTKLMPLVGHCGEEDAASANRRYDGALEVDEACL